MSQKIKLALIYGSNREERFCDVIAEWTTAQIKKRNDYELITIDPARMKLPTQIRKKLNPDLITFKKKISQADAFVIVTPEYNHGYPAVLKFLIDSSNEGWWAKPIAFVSYGGISGGIRAVEQLRQVFCVLHAVTISDSIHFINGSEQFDENRNLLRPEKTEKAASAVFSQLLWWAIALRNARIARPYNPPKYEAIK